MAIAGTIERTSSITLPRVLERIFDYEQPGSLRLKHKDSGKAAEVKIDGGAVQDTTFGDLKGDEAMKEISQTFPWEYEFVSSDTSITTGRLPVQPIARSSKRPALKLAGAVKPMMVLSGLTSAEGKVPPSTATGGVPTIERQMDAKPASKFMQPKSAMQPRAAAAKPGQAAGEVSKAVVHSTPAAPPSPVRRVSNLPTAESLAEWVDAGDEYALRFACGDDRHFGKVDEKELAYFRSDAASLMERASLIGDALGFSPPSLAAIVEPERAAAYRRLADGFAGIYCGPGSTVDSLLSIP